MLRGGFRLYSANVAQFSVFILEGMFQLAFTLTSSVFLNLSRLLHMRASFCEIVYVEGEKIN